MFFDEIREWDDEEGALLWRSTLGRGHPVKRYKAVKFFSQQELLIQEAADEIERLTAELGDLPEAQGEMLTEIRVQRAEIKRLILLGKLPTP